jgi:cell division protein FtsX
MQMGRLWTILIVAQVAFTVAVLPATMFHIWNSLRIRTGAASGAGQEFITTHLVMDRPSAAPATEQMQREFRSRYAGRQTELERRLETEAGVSAVTFSMTGRGEELALVLEVEGMPAPVAPVDYNIVEGTKRGQFVRFNRVGVDFFDAFDVPVVLGRGFQPADAASAGTPGRGVVVNRTFAERIFEGASPLGHRIRYVGRSREAAQEDVELNQWFEIVGVVQDFSVSSGVESDRFYRVYHAAAAGDIYPAVLAVRVRGSSPSGFASRLREVSASVDPNLQLRNISTAEDVLKREQGILRLIGITLTAVMLSVVILSAAGIYALMSFTVARRRREIGIRTALGADQRRILTSIFSRAFLQLGFGAAVGLLGAIGLERLLEGEMFQGRGAVILPAVALVMITVGVLAALGPARQGLRIHPTEALREE